MSIFKRSVGKTMFWVFLTAAVVIGGMFVGSAPAKPTQSRLEVMRQSPQWRDGKFFNELQPHSESLWTMLRETLRGDAVHRTPSQPVPVDVPHSEAFSTPPAKGLRITWLGHSSVLIEIDGYRVLTDPVWSNRASPFSFVGPKRFFAPPVSIDALPALDAVVVSHDHFDHLDEKTIRALKERVPLFAVPLGVGAHLEAWGVDPTRIVERDWWGEVKLGELTLTATPARHFSGRSLTTINLNETLWSGWSIAGPKHRVYYSGDTAMFPGFAEIGKRLGPFDLTMIEVGAYNAMWPDVHIGPEQAVQAHRLVRGRFMMPVHWATFDLAQHNWTEPVERLLVESKLQSVDVVVPRPGRRFEPSDPPELVRWWPVLPWQSADQNLIVSTGLVENGGVDFVDMAYRSITTR